MRLNFVRPRLALAAAMLAAAPLAAQSRTMVELSPYAGYMLFGDYLTGPFGTNVSNANGLMLGAQVALNLTPNLAVVGNVGRASADLEAGVPFLGGIGIGRSEVWLYDAGVQLSAPLRTRGGVGLSPFVQVGAGGMRHDIRNGMLKTDATNFAFNAGVGADLMLGRGFGVRLMARDYIGRFDTQDATQFDLVDGELSHNFALSAGVKLAF